MYRHKATLTSIIEAVLQTKFSMSKCSVISQYLLDLPLAGKSGTITPDCQDHATVRLYHYPMLLLVLEKDWPSVECLSRHVFAGH